MRCSASVSLDSDSRAAGRTNFRNAHDSARATAGRFVFARTNARTENDAPRPLLAESSGAPPSPKAAFGNARLFARTAAYGFRCELTLSATSGRHGNPPKLPQSGRSDRGVLCPPKNCYGPIFEPRTKIVLTYWSTCSPATLNWRSTPMRLERWRVLNFKSSAMKALRRESSVTGL